MIKICIGHWNSTPKNFDPQAASDKDAKREAIRQEKIRPNDPVVGFNTLEDFQSRYNADIKGDFELDPAFYWIRFLGIGKKTKPFNEKARKRHSCREWKGPDYDCRRG